MTDIPQWIAVARTYLGVEEVGGQGDNPTILGFVTKISALIPAQASYAGNYTHDDIAWCGLFADMCMVVGAGISGPFGPRDTDRWLWADSWMSWGKPSEPRVGAIVCFGGHVAFVNRLIDADTFEAIGGNQSSPQGGAVTLSRRRWSDVKATRWPAETVVATTPLPNGPVVPSKPFLPLDSTTISKIVAVAAASDLAQYSWRDRGRAPAGYIKGMAVTFGTALRKLAARDSAALAMVRVVDGPGDVFDHYELGTLGAPDIDRLRALWVVLTGLGMRESSGNYSEGRDMSATNVEADTAEAGLFQQSWNSHTTSQEITRLFNLYRPDGFYPGFIEIFREGVRDKATDNFGEGDGAAFQRLAKTKPAFAVECAAIGLRTLCTHWGPIIRREAEIVPAADALFRQVQTIVGPLDGEVLPPIKLDDDLLNLVFVLSQEGDTMDANLQAQIIAEIRKANPTDKALLLQALGAPGTIQTLPGPVAPADVPPATGLDLSKLLPLGQNPAVQQAIQKAIGDVLPLLVPAVLSILSGKPVQALPATVTPPVVTPPVVGTPPVPPGSNHVLNWSTALAALAGAFGLSAGGITGSPIPGDPSFSMTGLLSFIGPIIGAGTAPWLGPVIAAIPKVISGLKGLKAT